VESMWLLTEWKPSLGDRGCDRFWTRRYLPGLPGLGMMPSGDDWKGPMSCLTSDLEKGPKYRPFANSSLTMARKCS
jgi:hypothetical protein